MENFLNTTYAQAYLLVASFLALAISAGLATKAFKAFKAHRDLERDVQLNKLDIADLADRFGTWQKRDGMRAARAVTEKGKDLQAELERLALANTVKSPADFKKEMRANFRKRNGL